MAAGSPAEVEDVLAGPFWKALERERELVRQIERECLLVCIPVTSSLRALGARGPSRAVLLEHVFRASQFFLNEFDSVGGSVTISIANNEIVVKKTAAGEPARPHKAAILAEELMYPTSASLNTKKSYRVLTVSQLLDRPPPAKEPLPTTAGSASGTSGSVLSALFGTLGGSGVGGDLCYPDVDSFNNAKQFFHRWPENVIVLRKFAAACQTFNDSYVFVPGRHAQVVARVKALIDEYAQALTITNRAFKDAYKSSPQQLEPMYRLVVAYSMGFLFEKLYTQVCVPATKKVDQRLQELLYALPERDGDTSVATDMGVPDAQLLPYRDAVDAIARLPVYQSPGEKLHCLRTTLRLINRDIEDSPASLLARKTVMITNDELIPILSYVVFEAKTSNCFANLMFLEEFSFIPNKSVSPDAFLITTFRAALEYLNTFLSARAADAPSLPAPKPTPPSPLQKRVPIALAVAGSSSSSSSSSYSHGDGDDHDPASSFDPFVARPWSPPLVAFEPSIAVRSSPKLEPQQAPPPHHQHQHQREKAAVGFSQAPTVIDFDDLVEL